MEIQTDRAVAPAWRPDHIENYARIGADPEVMRYLGNAAARGPTIRLAGDGDVPGPLEPARVRPVGSRGARDGRFIGHIGLWNPEGWPGIEVGWLLDRDRWGCGLATEGARAAKGSDPPADPASPSTRGSEALAWAAASGVAMAVARLVAERGVEGHHRALPERARDRHPLTSG